MGTLVLLILVVAASTARDPRFLSASSLESILLWMPLLVVIGVGEMMVIVSKGIDVSVGSMVGLSAMVAGMAFRANPSMNVFVGLVIGLVVGTALGSLNGVLIAKAKVPAIVVTLGTLSAYRGLVFIVSHSEQVNSNEVPVALTNWSQMGPFSVGKVGLPWIVWIAAVVAVGAAYFLRRTRLGRNIYAIGNNPQAAALRGVPVVKTTFFIFAATGALCGLAGVLYLSRFGFVNPGTAGQGLELIVIASVVIGGTDVAGGSGTVIGVVLGALLLGAINVALAVLGIAETWQQLIYGAVILLAVVVDYVVRKSSRPLRSPA